MREPTGGQLVVQRAGGVEAVDAHLLGHQDRPLVEALAHPHHLDAGHRVAGHDRPLDRGRAAPAGQQAGVQVEAALAGRIQHRLHQDLAEGDDDGRVEVQGLEGCDLLGRLHRRRRADGQAQPFGEGVDRRGFQILAATARRGRLGIDGDDLVARGDQFGQTGDGEIGSAEESDAHGRGLAVERRLGKPTRNLGRGGPLFSRHIR
jgi:hypothetical protein